MPQTAQPQTEKNNAPSARAVSSARKQIVDALKEDHKNVKQAFEQFEKLDLEKDLEKATAIVQQVCQALQMHTQIEEELLYPAAREGIDDPQMMDEAEIEHESAKTLIQQLQQMAPEDNPDRWAATFTVLCEYVQHHVKEEEHEMFPKLTHVEADWVSLCEDFMQRRETLMSELGVEAGAAAKKPTHRATGSRH